MPKPKPEEEAKKLFIEGKSAFDAGKMDLALESLSKSLQFYRHSSDNIILAEIQRMLGEIYYERGELIESRNLYKRAYLAYKATGHKIRMADCYDKVDLSFIIQSELRYAEEYQEKALKIREKTPDKKGIARGLKNLAIIKYRITDDSTLALKRLDEAAELAKKSKDPQLAINIVLDKSKILAKIGNFEDAMQNALVARRLSKKFSINLPDDSELDLADILINLGLEKYDQGNLADSLKYLKNAVLIQKSYKEGISSNIEAIIQKLEEKIGGREGI